MESARPAHPDDLDRLGQLADQLIAELAGERGGGVWSAREARPRPVAASLSATMSDPDGLVLAGCLDGVIVGVASAAVETLRDGTRLAVVADLYVEPAARGVGVGGALMEAVVRWAGDRGCRGVEALVLPGLRTAKNFFEAHGLVARAIVVHRPLR